MASVWVPFTSESKEAIADYDEIRKEIRLALQECGRRLGTFLRRRERAKSEFRRRNIFELYIEEVVEACNRLKGGKLPKEKLKEQLQRIAMKRTGGEKTDEILGKKESGPEGLPHSIIVTPEGTEGEMPVPVDDVLSEGPSLEETLVDQGILEKDRKPLKDRPQKGEVKLSSKGKSKAKKQKPSAKKKTGAGSGKTKRTKRRKK